MELRGGDVVEVLWQSGATLRATVVERHGFINVEFQGPIYSRADWLNLRSDTGELAESIESIIIHERTKEPEPQTPGTFAVFAGEGGYATGYRRRGSNDDTPWMASDLTCYSWKHLVSQWGQPLGSFPPVSAL